MPAAPLSVAATAEEAAKNLILPAGWQVFEDSTPGGGKSRRVMDPQGLAYKDEVGDSNADSDPSRVMDPQGMTCQDEVGGNNGDSDPSRVVDPQGMSCEDEVGGNKGDSEPSEAKEKVTEECTSSPQHLDNLVKEVPQHAENAAASAEPKNEGRRGRRVNPKAKALAMLELVDGDVETAIGQAKSRLQHDEELVKQSSTDYVAAMAAVQNANEQLKALGLEVQTALEAESKTCDVLKEVQQRRQQANKTVDAKKAALQTFQEEMVIVEMKAEVRDVKRQKLAELQKAVADFEKAGEEIKRQEREAREAMRQLIKENKQTYRLGAFGRRQRERNMSTCNATELLAGVEVPRVGLPNVGEPGGSATSQEGRNCPVPIKREAMQAFARQTAYIPSEPVIILDD